MIKSFAARNKFTDDEIMDLIIGYNRYYESYSVYMDIRRDESLRIHRNRSNKDIKCKIEKLKESFIGYKGFFVPRNCQEDRKKLYIPDEFWFVLGDDDSELHFEVLEESMRMDFDTIARPFNQKGFKFQEVLDNLPSSINENSILNVPTFNIAYRIGFEKDSVDSRAELLRLLCENAIIRAKKVGTRTFIYKY